jgi:ubiquinone/menaquinone biosynthesis C-methylase UbiE
MSSAPSQKLTDREIRQYWKEQAIQHVEDPAASWSDRAMIDLEIYTITSYLRSGERVLDIGCANGYSTTHFATTQDISILGLDYIPEMIAAADARCHTLDKGIRKRLRFAVGDITKLDVATNSFDLVIVIRVIINLGTWENQLCGLKEAARVVRPGGRLIISEATVQGLNSLNGFRDEWGLAPIPEPPFNRYLDQTQVVQALSPEMELEEMRDFASTYYVGTRVLKPLLAKLVGKEPCIADPNMEWNRWFAMLPAAGHYGTQKLFVFRKASAPTS